MRAKSQGVPVGPALCRVAVLVFFAADPAFSSVQASTSGSLGRILGNYPNGTENFSNAEIQPGDEDEVGRHYHVAARIILWLVQGVPEERRQSSAMLMYVVLWLVLLFGAGVGLQFVLRLTGRTIHSLAGKLMSAVRVLAVLWLFVRFVIVTDTTELLPRPPRWKKGMRSARPSLLAHNASESVLFVTIATHSGRGFPDLVSSFRRHNATFAVLGWGQEWRGFVMKYELMLEFVRQLPPSQVVCFVDGFDSLVIGSGKELRDKFVDSGYDVVWLRTFEGIPDLGDSDAISLFLTYLMRTISGCNEFYCITTSTYVGYAASIADFLEYHMPPRNAKDDQRMVNVDQTPLLLYNHAVDWSNQLFVEGGEGGCCEVINGGGGNNANSRHPRYLVKASNTTPCVVAMNGGFYNKTKTILGDLGYDTGHLKLEAYVAESFHKGEYQALPHMKRDVFAVAATVFTTGFLSSHRSTPSSGTHMSKASAEEQP